MRTARGVAFASLLAALAAATAMPADAGRQTPGLQVALKARGLYAGPIDGIAGPMTRRAIRSFQKRNGLLVDGVPGPRTRAKLGRLGRPLFATRLMRRGMVGWDVSVLQFLLARRGVSTGGIDGIFGPGTQRALRRYQGRVGLHVDGVAGPVTRKALVKGAIHRVTGHRRSTASPAAIRWALGYWSRRFGVSTSLVRALAWMESGNQPNVVSAVGARGVMQVMPATHRFVEHVLVGKRIPHSAGGNIQVGILYLRHMLRLFNWNKRLALAAYYQGPKAVRRYGLFRESRVYVRAILALERTMFA
jgi:transglycosylase-like protein with SLT domain/putative peptidoglycan binding protein